MYEYKMVQVPRDLRIKLASAEGVAARYMQETVNAHARDGWEYYRVDNLTGTKKPGCLSALSKYHQPVVYHSVDVLCFRRAIPQKDPG